MKTLIRIFGSRADEWMIKENEEIKQLYQSENIVEEITKQRTVWIGHGWQMTGTSIRQVQEGIPQGK